MLCTSDKKNVIKRTEILSSTSFEVDESNTGMNRQACEGLSAECVHGRTTLHTTPVSDLMEAANLVDFELTSI